MHVQVAFFGFYVQHQAYPGKGPVQNLIVRPSPPCSRCVYIWSGFMRRPYSLIAGRW